MSWAVSPGEAAVVVGATELGELVAVGVGVGADESGWALWPGSVSVVPHPVAIPASVKTTATRPAVPSEVGGVTV